MGKLLEIWRRVRQDGGLLVMIALAVGICLLLPQGQEDTVGTSSQEEARAGRRAFCHGRGRKGRGGHTLG